MSFKCRRQWGDIEASEGDVLDRYQEPYEEWLSRMDDRDSMDEWFELHYARWADHLELTGPQVRRIMDMAYGLDEEGEEAA